MHLIAQNHRFLILPGCHRRNLASRVLGLSLRRLSADIRARYGHPVLLAESFVYPARFARTCYCAANRGPAGFTPGYARRPAAAPRWEHHGQAKEIYMYELTPGARAALSALDEGGDWRGQGDPRPLNRKQMRSLFDFLNTVPEFRGRQGRRHPPATLLAIAIAARMTGCRGVTAITEFAARLTRR